MSTNFAENKLMNTSYHTPVMLQEAIHHLAIKPRGTYVDLTFGGGGHARAILAALDGGSLWAFDQDQAALTEAEKVIHPNFHFVHSNFRFFSAFLRAEGIQQVDGILADLGVSSHQLDQADRGFAARLEGPLDMRMSVNNRQTAEDLLATASLATLRHIFRSYADIANAHKLAQTILTYRKKSRIRTTSQLCEAIADCIPPRRRYQYLAKVFQALRIVVNDEMGALEAMLQELPKMLAPEGRAVILSYHSGEDRLVKRFFQYGNLAGTPKKDHYGDLVRPLKPLEQKIIVPSEAEQEVNNRSRSARLRVAQRIG